jgi:hypothetical protein
MQEKSGEFGQVINFVMLGAKAGNSMEGDYDSTKTPCE